MATQYEQPADDELGEVSTEDRARAMGWKPQHEYRGDPRRWTDAAEFIAHGEDQLPILRDQNRRMSEKIARFEGEVSTLRNTVAEQAEAVKHAMDLARRADTTGYERGLRELKAKQREAVSVGDMETFDQIDEQIRAAETERAKDTTYVTTPIRAAEPVAAPVVAQVDPETSAFVAANPWFNQRPILKSAMIEAHKALVAVEGVQKGAALADQYERAKDDVVAAFPHFFPSGTPDPDPDPTPTATPRPKLRAPALTPNGQAPRPRGGSPFMRIEDPTERKQAEDAFASIKRQDPGATAEEYIAIYFGEINVLDAIAQRKKG